MADRRPHLLDRRLWLASVFAGAIASAQKPTAYASEARRFLDPATEGLIDRLTDPGHNSYLLPIQARSISRRSDQVLIASDRDESLRTYFLDLKNGQQRLAGEPVIDAPWAATLMPDERAILGFSGGRLLAWGSGANRLKAAPLNEWLLTEGPVASFDGQLAAAIVKTDAQFAIAIWNLVAGTVTLAHKDPQPLAELSFAPRTRALLFRRGSRELMTLGATGKPSLLFTADGTGGNLLWAPDGDSVFFLDHLPNGHTIKEVELASRKVSWTGATSQFSEFAFNRDNSVFIGASGSKASPLLLLMLKMNRRELPLAEHRTLHGARPMFTPNSKRVLFQTDRSGKSVIFDVPVERLVEETSEGSSN